MSGVTLEDVARVVRERVEALRDWCVEMIMEEIGRRAGELTGRLTAVWESVLDRMREARREIR